MRLLAFRPVWAEARQIEFAESLAYVLFRAVGSQRAEAALIPGTGREAGGRIDVQV